MVCAAQPLPDVQGIANMMIALTGATGFIGRYLLRELPKRGHRVRMLLRRPTPAMPLDLSAAVIGDLRYPQNLGAALAGVDAMIHSAGVTQAASGLPEDDYRTINTAATLALARAAERLGVSRFVFLSSIRAQCGPVSDTVMTEAVEARPTDAYGKSKLAAELGLAELNLDWVALRLVLVYGPGVKGNVAKLMKLARSPLPLPFGSITARRSLLSLENLTSAIEVVLAAPQRLRRAYIVADREALTVGQMIAAMRQGIGRKPKVFPFPPGLLDALSRTAGQRETYSRLSGPLTADASALMGLGWRPAVETTSGLSTLMRQTG
jgi:nucleoside-diphosphate-sugar epimerase